MAKWLNLVCRVNCSLHPTWGFKVMLQSLYQPDYGDDDDDNDDDDVADDDDDYDDDVADDDEWSMLFLI